MRLVAFATLLLVFCVGSSNAAIVNGSFESGLSGWSVKGTADTQTFLSYGVNPTDGSSFARIQAPPIFVTPPTATEIESFLGLGGGTLSTLSGALPSGSAVNGSAIKQTVYLTAGETLTFNWNFLTSDVQPVPGQFADFSFWSLKDLTTGTAVVLANVNDPGMVAAPVSTGYLYQTGWRTVSYLVGASGTYDLGFGYVSVAPEEGDLKNPPTLLVDNVQTPEPTTMTIWGIGALGCAFAAYRRKRKAA